MMLLNQVKALPEKESRPTLSVSPQVEVVVDEGVSIPAPLPVRLDPLPTYLRGFVSPILGTRVPTSPNLLPNAPRAYRHGRHHGVDFFVSYGTVVRAVKDGYVTFANPFYEEPPPAFREALLRESRSLRHETEADILHLLLGRHVIISHGLIGGRRVTTLYAHLSAIARSVRLGHFIPQGEMIGYVGNSGTEAGSLDSKVGAHLHFEIHLDGAYLGKNISSRNQLVKLFSQVLNEVQR